MRKGLVIALLKKMEKERCHLDINHPRFKKPTGDDFRTLRTYLSMTPTDVARYVGVKYTNNDSTTVRGWEKGQNINLAAWKLLCIKAGFISS